MNFASLKTSDTAITRGLSYISPNPTNEPLGKLLVLIEFRDRRAGKYALNLQEIVTTISEQYYSNEVALDTEVNIEERLENLAVDINAHIQNYFEFETIEELATYVDLFVGVVRNNTLAFTKTRRIHLLLQHGISLIDITEEESDDEDAENSSSSFFSYITSGDLASGDSMIISTDALLDYFSKEKLKSILTKNNAQSSVAEFEKLVDEFTKQTLFQTLVLQRNARIEAGKKAAKPKPRSSMEELNTLEYDTDSVMTNSLWKNAKKGLSNAVAQLKPKPRQNYQDRRDETPHRASEEALKRRLRQRSPLKKTYHTLGKVARSIALIIAWMGTQITSAIAHIFRNRRKIISSIQQTSKSLPTNVTSKVTNKVTRFRTLDARRRKLLIAGIVLVVVLIVSSVAGVSRKSSSLSNEEIDAILEEIEVKRSSAEAALIYGNEAKAVSLIAESRRLLDSIDSNKSDIKERKSELATNLFESFKKIQKLEEITTPHVAVDLSFDNNEQSRDILKIFGTSDTFFGYDTEDTVYQFVLSENTVNDLGHLPQPIRNMSLISDHEILIYSKNESESQITFIDTDKETSNSIPITLNNPDTDKASIVQYFTRLYVLDPRDRQIYKHSRIGNSYSKGEAWLEDSSVDLSNATAMAIDGNIWVTTSSGDFIKLTAGVREKFSTPTLDPVLNSPNYIWTSIDSNHLYIVDPPTRRIVILNKDGSIHQQFVSEQFDDLRGLVVDEANGKLYVLNGNLVFDIPFNK